MISGSALNKNGSQVSHSHGLWYPPPPRTPSGIWERVYFVGRARLTTPWLSLPSAGPWCIVKPTARLHFILLNKTYVNRAVEEFSLTLPPGIPHEEIVLEETQWPTSELKLADGRLLELLNQTKGLYSVLLVVDSSGKHMISLGDADNKSRNGLFGWYSRLLSSSNQGNLAPIFFLTILSVGFIVALIVSVYLCYRCYLTLIGGTLLSSGCPTPWRSAINYGLPWPLSSIRSRVDLTAFSPHIAHVVSRKQPERSSPPSPNSS